MGQSFLWSFTKICSPWMGDVPFCLKVSGFLPKGNYKDLFYFANADIEMSLFLMAGHGQTPGRHIDKPGLSCTVKFLDIQIKD